MSERKNPKNQTGQKWILLSCLAIVVVLGGTLLQPRSLAKLAPEKSKVKRLAVNERTADSLNPSILESQLVALSDLVDEKDLVIEDLKQALVGKGSSHLDLRESEDRFVVLQKEIDDYKNLLTVTKDEQLLLAKEVDRLQEERGETLFKLAELEDALRDRSTELTNLTVRLKEIEQERDDLKQTFEKSTALNEYSEIMNEIAVSKEGESRLRKALEDSVSSLTEASKQIEAMNSELSSLRTERLSILGALDESQDRVARLEKKMREEEAILRASAHNERIQKESALGELTRQNNRLVVAEDSLRSLELRLSTERDKSEELASAQSRIEEETRLRQAKEEVIAKMQSRSDAQKNDYLTIEKTQTALAEELKQMQTAYAQLMDELSKRGPQPGFTASPPASQRKEHIVQTGETLMQISQKYYGTTRKWRQILEANKEAIPNENFISPGVAILIP